MVILSHFSSDPFELDRTRTYTQMPHFKPIGLWLSDESGFGWKQWLTEQDWLLANLAYETQFEVDTTNVLMITTDQALDDFTNKYTKQVGLCEDIDWEQVASEYDGIIISPYSWACRLKHRWYYTWDCASGCIWNLQIIENKEHKETHHRATQN
jgi:hypothetical protein